MATAQATPISLKGSTAIVTEFFGASACRLCVAVTAADSGGVVRRRARGEQVLSLSAPRLVSCCAARL